MSTTKTLRRRRMSNRDRQILDHVRRFRLTTNEVVQKLFLPNQQLNAVTKVTARLASSGLLRSFPLYHPRTYFTLGDEGAAYLGMPENRALPLGPQSLPTEFAVLSYATLGRGYRERLTREELSERYSISDRGLIEQPYTDTDGVLELIRVDLGGAPDHIARKCKRDVELRVDSNEFRPVLEAGHFRLVVVTCTQEKSAAISSALNHHLWPDGLMIHLAIVPDLIFLTARLNDAT